MFIGRGHEIEQLNGFYEGEKAAVAVVSGQIGVGKSTLLRHFSEGKKTIYFDAYETTGKHQCELLAKKLGINTDADVKIICEKIAEEATNGKLLLIIDGYPNIVKGDPQFDAVLHDYIVGRWKNLPIKLILCSDAFVLIDKYVKSKKAVWRDAISLDLTLEPFGFYDSIKFFGDSSINESAYYYGLSGGIAANLVKIADMLGVEGFETGLATVPEQNRVKEITVRLFLDKNNAVGLNPEAVMATELRELSYYNYMLTTLARGLNRVNQISAEVDKPKDVVVPYLNTLMAIGVCTKETAITETNNRKKTRYSIVNTSTLFWYKFIAANFDLYCKGDVDGLWNIVNAMMSNYMTDVFIKICAEYLANQSNSNKLPFTVEETGNWWVNDDEAGTTEGFDLVSLGKCDGKSATIFCQCYYNKTPIEVPQLKSLIEKTKQLHRQGDVFYIVFSKAGFNENAITISSAIKNIMLIQLDEMR